MMLRVGLTGGIGSGKSTVSRVFALLGVPVYDTDSRAKELMGSVLADGIKKLLGDEAFVGGKLNRSYIAGRIFADTRLLGRIDAIVHPAVADDFVAWAAEWERKGAAYVVMECAILFEAGFENFVDRVVTVSAPEQERVGRVVRRGGITEEQVRERISCQLDDKGREERSDYTIYNSEEDMVVPQVLALHYIFTG